MIRWALLLLVGLAVIVLSGVWFDTLWTLVYQVPLAFVWGAYCGGKAAESLM